MLGKKSSVSILKEALRMKGVSVSGCMELLDSNVDDVLLQRSNNLSALPLVMQLMSLIMLWLHVK